MSATDSESVISCEKAAPSGYASQPSNSETGPYGLQSPVVSDLPARTNGAKNVLRILELLRNLPEGLQKLRYPVIQRNYWVHAEVVLVAHGGTRLRVLTVHAIQQYRQHPHSTEVPDYQTRDEECGFHSH